MYRQFTNAAANNNNNNNNNKFFLNLPPLLLGEPKVSPHYLHNSNFWRLFFSNGTGPRSPKRWTSRGCSFSWTYTTNQLFWDCSVLEICHHSITNFTSRATSIAARSNNVPCQSAVPEVWWSREGMDWGHWWSWETCTFWWEVCKVPGWTVLRVRNRFFA